jgi:hypothetical protein
LTHLIRQHSEGLLDPFTKHFPRAMTEKAFGKIIENRDFTTPFEPQENGGGDFI